MDFFPAQPKLTKSDVNRLLPHIRNEHVARVFLKTNPSREDVCKCIVLEIERAKVKFSPLHILNRGVLLCLYNYKRKIEKQNFESQVLNYLNQP